MELVGTRAVVSGGSRGIGRAICTALAAAGADVVVGYASHAEEAATTVTAVEAHGRRAVALQTDMRDPDSIHHFAAAATDALGGVDILVCNAGMNRRTAFLDIPLAEWDEVIGANLRGPFVLSQAVARHMIAQGGAGRIVFTTSISATVAYPNITAYQAAKAGLAMLMRSMAYELAPHAITVNAVAPGVTETDLTRPSITDPETGPRRLAKIPMGRFGQPGDLAGAIVYFASTAAAWTTGCTLTVDGGQTLA